MLINKFTHSYTITKPGWFVKKIIKKVILSLGKRGILQNKKS
jgi:hypothetical protein